MQPTLTCITAYAVVIATTVMYTYSARIGHPCAFCCLHDCYVTVFCRGPDIYPLSAARATNNNRLVQVHCLAPNGVCVGLTVADSAGGRAGEAVIIGRRVRRPHDTIIIACLVGVRVVSAVSVVRVLCYMHTTRTPAFYLAAGGVFAGVRVVSVVRVI